jgi:PDZ domain
MIVHDYTLSVARLKPVSKLRRMVAVVALLLPFANPTAYAQAIDLPPLPQEPDKVLARSLLNLSAVKINVTQQGFNVRLPWQKLTPTNKAGLGVLLPSNKILVTASLVQDASYIELEKPASGVRVAGKVAHVDYEANLALVEPLPGQLAFLADLKPMQLAPSVRVGDDIQAWQLGRSGELVVTPLVVNKVFVGRYALPSSAFLTLEANGILRAEGANVTLPIVHNGKLAGLLLRYDSRNQSATVLPAAIIEHFLSDLAKGQYDGFPSVGLTGHTTLDPQFRDYLGLGTASASEPGGLYVGGVSDGGSGQSLGIKAGDILLRINGKGIDSRGDVNEPFYGALHYSHLLRGDGFVGEQVEVDVQRGGQVITLQGKLVQKKLKDFVIPAMLADSGPNYVVHGGLIFQELSLPYLQSFGDDWEATAPPGLVRAASNTGELEKKGVRRVVFLSAVIPVPGAQGYQQLGATIVERVNNQALKDLNDLQNALKSPIAGVHKIEFDESPRTIFLDALQAEKDNLELTQGNYRIGQLVRIE